ncbi:ABC1 kinase family protein [Planctomicrobium sp. SH668]|uniref:ABC1 kinase family protein n=1 Tax=Planctomicrobium sp. SH668 TaxID=3448126 RepID=UPI003F5C87A6
MQPYPIRFLKNLNRGREVATVLLNYGFGDLLERLGLLPYLNWGHRLISRRKREASENLTTPRRIRMALQDLGPTFVKFGQVLSTRSDLIPADVIAELALLQESVPPFDVTQVYESVEDQFGRPIQDLVRSFDEVPLAAGSLGQVHTAIAKDGRRLAVKVRRPDVVQTVERDISLILELAQLLENHVPESRVFDPVGLVNQFTRTIRREMNFRREGRAMQEFARLFEGDLSLYVPVVIDELLSDSVLFMERVDGMKVDDIVGLRQCGLDPAKVASDGALIYLRMAFEMGVFHGDPHPGNIRIMPDGSICLLDYGMVGYLDEVRRDLLLDLFVSVARNDVDSAVNVVTKLGQATQKVDEQLLVSDVRDFLDAYYGVSLEQLRIASLLNDFIAILASHGLRCPGDLMVLVRAIVTLEGVGRKLDPHFNLAAVLAPYVESQIKQRYHPKKIVERAFEDLKILLGAAHDLPIHLGNTLKKIGQDDLKVQLEHRGLDRLINEFDRSSNRLVIGLLISSLVVSTALVIRSGDLNSIWIALPIFTLSGLLGIWLIWGILRSGRL